MNPINLVSGKRIIGAAAHCRGKSLMLYLEDGGELIVDQGTFSHPTEPKIQVIGDQLFDIVERLGNNQPVVKSAEVEVETGQDDYVPAQIKPQKHRWTVSCCGEPIRLPATFVKIDKIEGGIQFHLYEIDEERALDLEAALTEQKIKELHFCLYNGVGERLYEVEVEIDRFATTIQSLHDGTADMSVAIYPAKTYHTGRFVNGESDFPNPFR